MILAAMDDLIFGVKIQEAARRAGQPIEFTARPEVALAKARSFGAAGLGFRVIVDLNLRGVDTLELIRDLKAIPVTVIAYVAHVQVELRRGAELAGADQVLARSDRKSTRLNSSHGKLSRMPSSA